MQIQFTVNAASLHRAWRGLGKIVESQSGPGNQSIVFKIVGKGVQIVSTEVSHAVGAQVHQRANVSVPCTVLYGVIGTLPYFGEKDIEISFSKGRMRIDRMVFHNRRIVLTKFRNGARRDSS